MIQYTVYSIQYTVRSLICWISDLFFVSFLIIAIVHGSITVLELETTSIFFSSSFTPFGHVPIP